MLMSDVVRLVERVAALKSESNDSKVFQAKCDIRSSTGMKQSSRGMIYSAGFSGWGGGNTGGARICCCDKF